jgi:hypothetical protein
VVAAAMTNPRTPRQWQEAVDSAAFLLLLDSTRQYGLITGGPAANVERCHELLAEGKRLGYRPASADALVAKFISGAGSAEARSKP